MRHVITALATALLISAAPSACAASPYDAMVDAVMARYHLPGLAVGVIKNGKVVYIRTDGVLAIGSGKPVTSDTLFKIASNTKAFTTALLARLVQQGKLKWNDPVRKYLPKFGMYEPWVARNMQVRDLLMHDNGLRAGAGDLMLWPQPNDFTRADIVAGLKYIKPIHSFRATYAYSNTSYVIAGQVAAAAGGASYEHLMRREVFKPLGLTRCIVGRFNRDEVGNVAQPHTRSHGHWVVTGADGKIVPLVTAAAAGGVRCSLNAMLKWAQNWLAPTPKQLAWLSPKQRRILWSAHRPIPLSPRRRAWDHAHFFANGYGWHLEDVDGKWVVWHTGTLSGVYSALTLLPDQKTGFVILINAEAPDARRVLKEVILKHFTAPGRGRSVASYADELARAHHRQQVSHMPDTSSRVPATAHELERELGIWRSPWFGKVSLCEAHGKVRFSSAKSPMMMGIVMRVGNRYLVDWDNFGPHAEAWLEFAQEKPVVLQMAKVDPDADFSWDYEDLAFRRIGACRRAGNGVTARLQRHAGRASG
ncbi:MAG TPA: serine hydrolase domain-containing protein [Gammaproteobacteria bacterium]|nr:serine hydrolase domain-containing protein [Gammaproteobacteria bacterium]